MSVATNQVASLGEDSQATYGYGNGDGYGDGYGYGYGDGW